MGLLTHTPGTDYDTQNQAAQEARKQRTRQHNNQRNQDGETPNEGTNVTPVRLTQEQYDAISNPSQDVFYIVTGNPVNPIHLTITPTAPSDEPAPDPDHLWNVADYPGTGPLADTIGGIDLPMSEAAVFANGRGTWDYPNGYNSTTGIPFGTDDFTILWVGNIPDVATATGNVFTPIGAESSGPQLIIGNTAASGGRTILGAGEAASGLVLQDGLSYAALTRQDGIGSVTTPYESDEFAELDMTMSLTTANVAVGLSYQYEGYTLENSAIVVWLGTALTPGQLAAAAAEYGWAA